MRRSSAHRDPRSKSKREPRKTHKAEVSDSYLKAVASIEESIPKETRHMARYRERNEERARYRAAELRRGERLQNGDKWGNTWYRRHRYLENIIERHERDIRRKRMMLGWNYEGSYTLDNLADVSSAIWPSAAALAAYLVGTYRMATYMRLSPAGSEGKPSSTPTT